MLFEMDIRQMDNDSWTYDNSKCRMSTNLDIRHLRLSYLHHKLKLDIRLFKPIYTKNCCHVRAKFRLFQTTATFNFVSQKWTYDNSNRKIQKLNFAKNGHTTL